MAEADPTTPVAAEQIAALRRLTDLPWMECKRYLASLTPAERQWYVAAAEAQPGDILHDPIEDDPAVRPLFLAISEEAAREVREWHRLKIAELEQESLAVADLFRSGRGLCYRIWSRIKELLRQRHGIEWRSPPEMNPWVTFD